jgi:hypothetical protein
MDDLARHAERTGSGKALPSRLRPDSRLRRRRQRWPLIATACAGEWGAPRGALPTSYRWTRSRSNGWPAPPRLGRASKRVKAPARPHMPKIDDAWAHAAHERPRARCARLIDRVLDLLQGERRSEDASAPIERLSWLPADEARSERPLVLPTASGGPARVDRADACIVERVRVIFDALRTRARRTPVQPLPDGRKGASVSAAPGPRPGPGTPPRSGLRVSSRWARRSFLGRFAPGPLGRTRSCSMGRPRPRPARVLWRRSLTRSTSRPARRGPLSPAARPWRRPGPPSGPRTKGVGRYAGIAPWLEAVGGRPGGPGPGRHARRRRRYLAMAQLRPRRSRHRTATAGRRPSRRSRGGGATTRLLGLAFRSWEALRALRPAAPGPGRADASGGASASARSTLDAVLGFGQGNGSIVWHWRGSRRTCLRRPPDP